MKSVRLPVVKTKSTPWRTVKSDSNALDALTRIFIGDVLKPPKDKNQRAFFGGSWSDSGEEDDEKVKNETCLVAHTSSKVCFKLSYFSDENSSIDDLALGPDDD
ncbi:hypothetical protein Tco_1004820 [Tanacetum coccineum]|uniref:Uncharacterized protein n=1 Tax=Tanacetum coccineum TaxID=301880 RepID=A0ABQ5FEV8_9ASTR